MTLGTSPNLPHLGTWTENPPYSTASLYCHFSHELLYIFILSLWLHCWRRFPGLFFSKFIADRLPWLRFWVTYPPPPLQSHAQKYFLRLERESKIKKPVHVKKAALRTAVVSPNLFFQVRMKIYYLKRSNDLIISVHCSEQGFCPQLRSLHLSRLPHHLRRQSSSSPALWPVPFSPPRPPQSSPQIWSFRPSLLWLSPRPRQQSPRWYHFSILLIRLGIL